MVLACGLVSRPCEYRCGIRCVADKRLNLPLVSYGGTSLVVSALAIGLLLRIDHERRMSGRKVAPRGGAE